MGSIGQNIEQLGSLRLFRDDPAITDLRLRTTEVSARHHVDLYDLAPVGYCTLDVAGRVLEVNLAGAELFGLEREFVINKPLRGLLKSIDYSLFWSHLSRCFEVGERSHFEIQVVTRAQRQLTLEVRTTPLYDAANKPVACLAILVDATARKEAEHSLQFLSRLSQQLSCFPTGSRALSEIAAAVLPLPADAAVVQLQERTFWKPPDGVAFNNPEKLPVLERLLEQRALLPSVEGAIGTALSTGETLLLPSISAADRAVSAYDPILRAWTQELELNSFAILPLLGRESAPTAVLWLGRQQRSGPFRPEQLPTLKEVASRCAMALDNARLYEVALRSIRLRDEFVAMVSHDLSNAVSAVALTSSAIAEQPAQAENRVQGTREEWERVHRAAQWMQRLIRRLLDISYIESGRFEISAYREEVGGLINPVLEMVEPAAAKKRITIRTKVPPSTFVIADRDRIQQVLTNLLGNAIKFSADGTEVAVEIEPRERVIFSVSDQGPGISPEDQKRIFDRFWQSRRARQAGVGLGLAIARGIVEAHGSPLEIDSVLGHGSTFRFSLVRATSSG